MWSKHGHQVEVKIDEIPYPNQKVLEATRIAVFCA